MNARSIRKRLMQHRVNSFWGRRALLTMSIPLKHFPDAFPRLVLPESWVRDRGAFAFTIRKPHDDGTFTQVILQNLHSGARAIKRWQNDPHTVKCAVVSEEYDDAQAWSASIWRGPLSPSLGMVMKEDSKEVALYRDDPSYAWLAQVVETLEGQQRWVAKYVRGEGDDEYDQRLREVNYWTKTQYHAFDFAAERLLLTFSVKWFYPDRKKRFCAEAGRFHGWLKSQGIDARVY